MRPGLTELNSRLAGVSAKISEIWWHNPKMNNQQTADCLAACCPDQWTRAHGSTGERQCGMNSVPELPPAKTWCRSVNSEQENWLLNCPDLNLIDRLFSLEVTAPDGVSLQNVRHWVTGQLKCMILDCWAQLSQDTFNREIFQLPRSDNLYQGRWRPSWILSGLTVCFSTVCWVKNEKNPAVLVKYTIISGVLWFMQIRQRIFKLTYMQVWQFIYG